MGAYHSGRWWSCGSFIVHLLSFVVCFTIWWTRSDAAWKNANYAQIWEFLRDDFELDERFESLDFKLNIIQVWCWPARPGTVYFVMIYFLDKLCLRCVGLWSSLRSGVAQSHWTSICPCSAAQRPILPGDSSKQEVWYTWVDHYSSDYRGNMCWSISDSSGD